MRPIENKKLKEKGRDLPAESGFAWQLQESLLQHVPAKETRTVGGGKYDLVFDRQVQGEKTRSEKSQGCAAGGSAASKWINLEQITGSPHTRYHFVLSCKLTESSPMDSLVQIDTRLGMHD
jgi:hypothetical protein